MVSANYRESRQVQALMDAAQSQLAKVMASSKDAAESSVETVMKFIRKLEDSVLESASDKCAAMGLPIDLKVVYELFKGNANECVTNVSHPAPLQTKPHDARRRKKCGRNKRVSSFGSPTKAYPLSIKDTPLSAGRIRRHALARHTSCSYVVQTFSEVSQGRCLD